MLGIIKRIASRPPVPHYNAASEASTTEHGAGYRAGTIPERIYRASGGKLASPQPAPNAGEAANERVREKPQRQQEPLTPKARRAADLDEAKGFVGRHQTGGGATVNPNDIADAANYAEGQRLAE